MGELAQPSDESARALRLEIERIKAEKQQMEDDRVALIQEFTNASDSELPDKVLNNLRKMMPDALEILAAYMTNAKSEQLRVSVAKFIIEKGLAPKSLGVDVKSNSFKKLLEGISAE